MEDGTPPTVHLLPATPQQQPALELESELESEPGTAGFESPTNPCFLAAVQCEGERFFFLTVCYIVSGTLPSGKLI